MSNNHYIILVIKFGYYHYYLEGHSSTSCLAWIIGSSERTIRRPNDDMTSATTFILIRGVVSLGSEECYCLVAEPSNVKLRRRNLFKIENVSTGTLWLLVGCIPRNM
jgi:hypothetical protein